MTSFFAQSFEFFYDKPASVCAFLATTRPIFNSSIIPVTLNMDKLWSALTTNKNGKHTAQPLLQIFLLSDTLQFSPSLRLGSSSLSESFTVQLLETLIHKRRYFCRTLEHFKTVDSAALALVCEHVPSLESLDCWSSGIDNWQPIARLTRLRVLNLEYCNVADEDLENLAGLTSLEKLYFKFGYLIDGNGFEHLSGMKMLRVLGISTLDSLCDAGLACLPELPSLVELNLSNSYKITDVGVVAAVKKQKNLRIFNLSGCDQIFSEGEGLKSLRELPDLTDLDLSGCRRINDNSLSILASIEGSLRRLSLAYCSLISDEGVTMLVNEMKDLAFLDLTGCPTLTDTSLKAISNLKYLMELRITHLPLVSDEGVRFLKNCPQLSTIFFGDENYSMTCSVTDLSLEAFSQMKSLTHLVLYRAKTFTNNGIAKLADSKSLERFELYEANDVTNDAMLPLSKSTALRTINVKPGSQINKGAMRFFQGTKIHVEISETYH